MLDDPPASTLVERALTIDPLPTAAATSSSVAAGRLDSEVILGYRWAMLGLDALLYLSFGLSACLRAFAVDFPTLLLAVGLFGVGGPMISVGSNKVVSEWFPKSKRGPAIGLASSALTVAGHLLPPF
jgi:MFS family permease